MNSLPMSSDRMLRAELSTEVRNAESPLSTGVQSPEEAPLAALNLDAVICLALARAGLTHDQACAWMGGLDSSQWTKQRKGENNAHVSTQRLMKLPRAFWLEFLQQIATPLGIVIAHPEIADRALNELFSSVQNAVTYALQDRALRQRQRVG